MKKLKNHAECIDRYKKKWWEEKWRQYNDKILWRNAGNFINIPRVY